MTEPSKLRCTATAKPTKWGSGRYFPAIKVDEVEVDAARLAPRTLRVTYTRMGDFSTRALATKAARQIMTERGTLDAEQAWRNWFGEQ